MVVNSLIRLQMTFYVESSQKITILKVATLQKLAVDRKLDQYGREPPHIN